MPEPGRHLRLVFAYEDGTLRLLGQYATQAARTQTRGAAPTVLETRDTAGRTLARVPIAWEPQTHLEVPPATPEGEMTRVDLGDMPSAFAVVIDAPEAATTVAVRRILPGVRRPDGRPTGPSEEDLGTFPLHPAPQP